jgi:hypothetical protein
VTRRTLVGVEARPQPIVATSGDDLDVLESGEPILEELSLVRRKVGQSSPGTRRAAAHAGVDGPFHRCGRRVSPKSGRDWC